MIYLNFRNFSTFKLNLSAKKIAVFLFLLFFSDIHCQFSIPNYEDPDPMDIVYNSFFPKHSPKLKSIISLNIYNDTVSRETFDEFGNKTEYNEYSSNKLKSVIKNYYSKNKDTIKSVKYYESNHIKNYFFKYYDKKGRLIKQENSQAGSPFENSYFFYDEDNLCIRKSNSETPHPNDIKIFYKNKKPVFVIQPGTTITFKYNADFLLEERVDSLSDNSYYRKKYNYINNKISNIFVSFNFNKDTLKYSFEYKKEKLYKVKLNFNNQSNEELEIEYNGNGNLKSLNLNLDYESKPSRIISAIRSYLGNGKNFKIEYFYNNRDDVIEIKYIDLNNVKKHKSIRYIYDYY